LSSFEGKGVLFSDVRKKGKEVRIREGENTEKDPKNVLAVIRKGAVLMWARAKRVKKKSQVTRDLERGGEGETRSAKSGISKKNCN